MKPAEWLAKSGGPSQDEAARRYEHGTYARYTLGMCRCFKCRLANSDYVNAINAHKLAAKPWRLVKGLGNYVEHRETRERIALPDRASCYVECARRNALVKTEAAPNQLVPIKRTRAHLARLRKAGIGLKSVAAATGLSASYLGRLWYRTPICGRKPINRLRKRNEEKILAVGLESARAGCRIDGAETWRQIDEMLAGGWNSNMISRALGFKAQALQIKRGVPIAGKSVKRVAALYAAWRTAPEETFARYFRARHPRGPKAQSILAAARAAHSARYAAPASATSTTKRTPAQERLAKALASWDTDEFAVRISRLGDLAS